MRHHLTGAFVLLFYITATSQFNEAVRTQAVAMVTDKAWAPKTNASSALTDSVYWITVNTDSGIVHAAVAMPEGSGPFPAVIILH